MIFLKRERERLLAKHVLASLQGLDGNFYVPGIARHDAHDIDVLSLQNLAVVAVGICLALADGIVIFCGLSPSAVHVAHRYDIAKRRVCLRIAHAHRACADAADPKPVAGRLVGKGIRRRSKRRNGSAGHCSRSSGRGA